MARSDYNNHLLGYIIQLFGFKGLHMLRFLLDHHWKAITGCPRTARHGAD